MANHAEVMARVLAERGVQYVFGLPGGEIVAFIDACRRQGLRFLLTGHEASAAWMAQVVGQITGIPGVCASTLGPGATNLVTGVANAWLDRAPLIAVTAQIPGSKIQTMTHQRLPLDQLFSPITKASVHIGGGDTVNVMNSAMDLAAAQRQGPVHIALASDVAVNPCGGRSRAMPEPIAPVADPEALGRIVERLKAAKRPLVIIGLGAGPRTAAAVQILIERLQAPFLVTPKAKGVVSEEHPLFAGVASGMAIDRDILETIRCADLVLGIGFDPVECDKSWFCDVDLVSIDSASMAEGDYRPTEAIGEIAGLIAQLLPRLSKPQAWPSDLVEQRRAAIHRTPREVEGALSPLRVIEELRSIFPRHGIATCDVGSHKLVMGQFWRSYEPGTFFMSNGLSGMGFGLPAAMAAQLVHPEKPVIAVVGDGGMLMMLHDLTLMRELGLPIVVVVLSDRSLSLIRVSAERRGFPPYGVDFAPPDFAGIAQSFGIAGRCVSTIEDLRSSVEQAVAKRTALVLNVPIDYREYYDLV